MVGSFLDSYNRASCMAASSDAKPAVPPLRLSIAHLLMLMVAFSVTFAIVGHNFSRQPPPDPLEESFEKFRRRAAVMEVCQAGLIAVALAGAAACLVALRRGQIVRLAPGHVLLLIQGPVGLLMLATTLFNDAATYSVHSDWQLAAIGAGYLAKAAGGVAFAWMFRRTWLWLAYGVLGTSANAIFCAFWVVLLLNKQGLFATDVVVQMGTVMGVVLPAAHGLALPLLGSAIVVDRRHGEPRDWLHFLGIAQATAAILFQLAISFV